MSKLSSQHHSFDINIAKDYGIEESILIHHFQHWVRINASLKRHFHEGTYWTYQTIDEIVANFPYMSREKIINTIEKLCTGRSRFSKKGESSFDPVLKKGHFHKNKYDRTVWYAFCDYTKWILCEHKIEIVETQDRKCKPTKCIDKDTDAIPYSKTDIDTREAKAPEPPISIPSFNFGKVTMAQQDYDNLVKKFGKMSVQEKIEALDDRSRIYPAEFKKYKCHATVIKTWIAKDLKKAPEVPKSEEGNPIPSREEIKAKNRTLCRNIDKKYRDLVNAGLIYISNDYIEINKERINMDDPELRKKCIETLMKIGRNPSGI